MTVEATQERRDGAINIAKTLRNAGYEALWAGGCVRDMLLKTPPQDYDIATNATPDQVMTLFPKTVPVGAHFGVVCVIEAGVEYDVATFRTETGYADGRRPDRVAWADAEADVARRDFTINGLLYDPLADIIIDYVDGQTDLAAGLIRAIGNARARLKEDRLRILRAIRFAARFNFSIHPDTWEALCDAAPQIGEVSVERTFMELNKILTEGGAFVGLSLLDRSGLWPYLLPEPPTPQRTIGGFKGVGRLTSEAAWTLFWYTTGLSIGDWEIVGKKLRMSNVLVRTTGTCVSALARLIQFKELPVAVRKRLVRDKTFPTTLAVARHLSENALFPCSSLDAADATLACWSEGDLWPAQLINGRDLQDAGFQPGPWFAKVLRKVEDQQLEGVITTRDEAMALVAAMEPDSAHS